jgi:signal transduction histidine kinase
MRIIWANKTTTLALNMPTEDVIGQTCHKLFVGRDTPCEGCPAEKARETGKIENAIMHKPKVKGIEGESYWDVYCVPLKNEVGEIENFIQISRNVTDRRRAEEHINALTQQLMRVQESERQKISLYLHDKIAQDLSTLKISCETLFDNQEEVSSEIRQRISEFSKIL